MSSGQFCFADVLFVDYSISNKISRIIEAAVMNFYDYSEHG